MIPKIIHYCWFGPKEKDDKIRSCIRSWYRFLPDYTFKEWTDKDISKLAQNHYVNQAYQAKKYAFVSDVFRLYALYTEGGIYLDTDVEVKKSFNPLLNLDFFIGSERYGHEAHIGTAVIGAQKNSPIINRLLKTYDDIEFITPTGYDMTPNTRRLMAPLKSCGFKRVYTDTCPIYKDRQNIIFPTGIFSEESKDSYTVHHFMASWVDDFKCQYHARIRFFKNIFGFYKYKQVKSNGTMVYPVNMIHKLAEFKYGQKHKILITKEREKHASV